MDENKLSYRRIRNDVHIRLNNKEAATFLALMFYSDFNTGESHVIHKTLRDKTGIPESTLKKYLKELAEKLGNSTLTVEQLDSIKEDIEEMTCMLNLEFE